MSSSIIPIFEENSYTMLRNHSSGPLKTIEKYAEEHTSSTISNALLSIERFTHLHTLKPQMSSGFYQGRVLSMISWISSPKNILEVGTFTSYATHCLREGLAPNGHIDSIESNEELYYKINALSENQVENIKFHLGDALNIIPSLTKKYDIIFIDADKYNYPKYYELCLNLLSERGLMILDNVLWDGKVTLEKKDKKAKVLDELNKKITIDPKVDNVLLPIRDGMMLIKHRPY